MGDQIFQNQLRPAFGFKFGGKFRQGLAFQTLGQAAATKRPVHNHRNAAIICQWQKIILNLAVNRVIGHLHEIKPFILHHRNQVFGTSPVRSRHTDMAQLPFVLHAKQKRQVFIDAQQIMDLQKVKLLDLPSI